ncbi:hypothetical protein CEXT_267291 [Caerostris extrusa]|uniref:Uncharacterized protein n=1 Tax=Caerostris extrusa TaxID=172846 RepID=A0AAV4R212_CAEEX|nr:hypothetical protein CEXT_267291 [Caerostris extrusa]
MAASAWTLPRDSSVQPSSVSVLMVSIYSFPGESFPPPIARVHKELSGLQPGNGLDSTGHGFGHTSTDLIQSIGFLYCVVIVLKDVTSRIMRNS